MDENKRQSNLLRHGIDFRDAIQVWDGQLLEAISPQSHHGEDRFLATGMANGRLITVIFTWRGNCRRIISARVARKYERTNYQGKIGGTSRRLN